MSFLANLFKFASSTTHGSSQSSAGNIPFDVAVSNHIAALTSDDAAKTTALIQGKDFNGKLRNLSERGIDTGGMLRFVTGDFERSEKRLLELEVLAKFEDKMGKEEGVERGLIDKLLLFSLGRYEIEVTGAINTFLNRGDSKLSIAAAKSFLELLKKIKDQTFFFSNPSNCVNRDTLSYIKRRVNDFLVSYQK